MLWKPDPQDYIQNLKIPGGKTAKLKAFEKKLDWKIDAGSWGDGEDLQAAADTRLTTLARSASMESSTRKRFLLVDTGLSIT